MSQETLTIAGLAGAASVNVETIRFYQRRRLLAVPSRPTSGIRRCGAADAACVRFIKAAQRIGFTLDEIADLLELDDGMHCTQARSAADGLSDGQSAGTRPRWL